LGSKELGISVPIKANKNWWRDDKVDIIFGISMIGTKPDNYVME
jgi:hypothetical protein